MSEQDRREFANVVALQYQFFIGQREHGRMLNHAEERQCHENADAFLIWFFGTEPPYSVPAAEGAARPAREGGGRMKLPIVSVPPDPCATCGESHYDTGAMTFCDVCEAVLCAYCARTITGEDVVCPACYDRHMPDDEPDDDATWTRFALAPKPPDDEPTIDATQVAAWLATA